MKRNASRRDVFKGGAGLAVAAVSAPLVSSAAFAAEAGETFARRSGGPGQRTLLKGGTIISMDPAVGDFVRGDLLIEGKRIVAVGGEIGADAQIIDASETILIPGFVDTHRHAWEAQLRRINPNAATLDAYSVATHRSFALAYRPHDMYVANTITALACIDAGITCFIDCSHNARSADHSDESIRGLFDTGIRAVHASGRPNAGEWDRQWPQDLERIQREYFSSADQLVTLRMFSAVNAENWAFARRLGLRITTEFQGPAQAALLDAAWRDRLVGPDNTLNHCGALPERTWRIIRESDANINVCPRSDSQYGLGAGIAAYQEAVDHGIEPGFSVDNETSYSGDMFNEMHVAFHMQRAMAQNRRFAGYQNIPAPVNVRDVLKCATINGAVCAGLADKIGTLAPGKEADIVLIRTGDINLYPSNNAIGTVVSAADRGNVDTVIVGGKVRKYRGTIVGLDMAAFKRMTDESHAYLFEKAGYTPDIFAEEFRI